MLIAIDGLSNTGKTKCAKELAKILGINVFNTGNVYRAIILKMISENVKKNNKKEIKRVLSNINITLKNNKIYLDNIDVTKKIKTQEVSEKTMIYSDIKEIKEYVRNIQNAFIKNSKDLVMEGRDIAERIMPNADFKFYLYSDSDTKALRLSKKRTTMSYKDVKKEIESRDQYDITTGNFVKPTDSIEINVSDKTIDEVVQIMLENIKNVK